MEQTFKTTTPSILTNNLQKYLDVLQTHTNQVLQVWLVISSMVPTLFSVFSAISGSYCSSSSTFYTKPNLISRVFSLSGSKKNKTKICIISSPSYPSSLPSYSASSTPLPSSMSCRSTLVLVSKASPTPNSLPSKLSSKEIPVILFLFSHFLLICVFNCHTLVYPHVPIWLPDFNN
jgi:hypothetical protein